MPASILNSSIAISGGAISGIGSGSGTVVDNSLVTATGIGAIRTDASNAPSSVLNSNISIGSNGALSGGGGGAVTIAGLDNTVLRAANPITAGNISTYIASAAIGAAQIGTLTAANLTVAALSSTINGGASSGARVEIATNSITIYDSAGNVRIRMSA